MMQSIILCGGQGTRLRSVIGEKQKTMTEINNEPFLVNIIKYLKSYKITNVIFATGYKSHEVRNYFGDKYFFGVEVSYAEEKIALGTGGAIRNCLDKMKYDYVLILNGDTLFNANLYKLEENFLALNADMSIACKEITDKSRYGTIKIDYSGIKTGGDKEHGIIESFVEKTTSNLSDKEDLYINGGIYVMKKSLIETIPSGVKSSLEKDLIPKWLAEGKIIGAEISSAEFVDIGTPDSLKEFKEKREEL